MSQTNTLWSELQQKGLVSGSEPEQLSIDSPWYVKILLAFSGWLAALFVFAFLAFIFIGLLDNAFASFIVGGLMIGGAFYLLRIPQSEFFEHIGLAISLAGQALIVIALFKINKNNDLAAWCSVCLMQISLAVIMPNFIHRVFSSYFSVFALSVALYLIGVFYLVSGIVMFLSAWLWLNEFKFPQYHKQFNAIGYGLVLALIQIKGFALFSHGTFFWDSNFTARESWVSPWLGELLTFGTLFYVVWTLLKRYQLSMVEPTAIVFFLITLLFSFASIEAQGITVGLVIILLGFAQSNRVLLGLGLLSLLFYMSSYYYLLDATLFEKSQTLLIIGLLLLAMHWLLIKSAFWKKEGTVRWLK